MDSIKLSGQLISIRLCTHNIKITIDIKNQYLCNWFVKTNPSNNAAFLVSSAFLVLSRLNKIALKCQQN